MLDRCLLWASLHSHHISFLAALCAIQLSCSTVYLAFVYSCCFFLDKCLIAQGWLFLLEGNGLVGTCCNQLAHRVLNESHNICTGVSIVFSVKEITNSVITLLMLLYSTNKHPFLIGGIFLVFIAEETHTASWSLIPGSTLTSDTNEGWLQWNLSIPVTFGPKFPDLIK